MSTRTPQRRIAPRHPEPKLTLPPAETPATDLELTPPAASPSPTARKRTSGKKPSRKPAQKRPPPGVITDLLAAQPATSPPAQQAEQLPPEPDEALLTPVKEGPMPRKPDTLKNPDAIEKAAELDALLNAGAGDLDGLPSIDPNGGPVDFFDAPTPAAPPRGATAPPEPVSALPPPPPLQRQPAREPVGAPVARRIDQVFRGSESVELFGVDNLGHEIFIGPYLVSDIAAGGDPRTFLLRFVQPSFPAIGRFRFYANGKQGRYVREEVVLAVPGQAPGAPWGAPAAPQPWWAPQAPGAGTPPGGVADQADAFSKVFSAVEGSRRAAQQEAQAGQRQQEGLMGMLLQRVLPPAGQGGGSGGSDPLTMMLLMKAMDGNKADPTERIYRDFGDALKELQGGLDTRFREMEQRMLMSAQPPMLPPAGPDPIQLVTTIASMLRPPDPLAQLAALKEVFGGGASQADVQLAAMGAKLEMLATQPRNGTLDDLGKMVEFIEAIRPASDPWVSVVEKGLDKLPELVDKVTGVASLAKLGGTSTPQKKVPVKRADGTKRVVPVALLDAVKTIEGLDIDGVYEDEVTPGNKTKVKGAFLVVKAVFAAGKALLQAGDPWAADVRALFAATVEKDLPTCGKQFATLLVRGLGKSPQVRKVLHKIGTVWKANIGEIAAFLQPRVAGAQEGTKAEEAVEQEQEEQSVEDAVEALLSEDAEEAPEEAADGVPEEAAPTEAASAKTQPQEPPKVPEPAKAPEKASPRRRAAPSAGAPQDAPVDPLLQ